VRTNLPAAWSAKRALRRKPVPALRGSTPFNRRASVWQLPYPAHIKPETVANIKLALCLAGTSLAPSPPSIVAEAAAVLFNVGAHYAQIAATLDLSTLDGLRLAATYFQVS